jgi:hypothetical protein
MALRLVKATHEVRDDEEVLVREAEAALLALLNTMRQISYSATIDSGSGRPHYTPTN